MERQTTRTTEQLSALLLRLAGELKRYNDYKVEDHRDMYMTELGKLIADFGPDVTERGFAACLNDTKRENFHFRPLPQEFRDYVVVAKTLGSLKYGSAKDNCPVCDGTGWAPIADRVKKCECRRIA